MDADRSYSNPELMIKGQIDENLKRIHDATLNAQIPDRLLELVRRLTAKLSTAPHSPSAPDDDHDPA